MQNIILHSVYYIQKTKEMLYYEGRERYCFLNNKNDRNCWHHTSLKLVRVTNPFDLTIGVFLITTQNLNKVKLNYEQRTGAGPTT